MCTALFFYDVHPTLLFLLAFNREEYQERCGLDVHIHACTPMTPSRRKGGWRAGRAMHCKNLST